MFLSNLAQILTSYSEMDVKSADIRSISQCREVYVILSTDEKRTPFYFKSFVYTILTRLRIIKYPP